MDLQEIDRRIKIFTEELDLLYRVKELLESGFSFGAEEIESGISLREKKISMLQKARSEAHIRQAEKSAARLILAIYEQGNGTMFGERLRDLRLWRHIKQIAGQIEEGENDREST